MSRFIYLGESIAENLLGQKYYIDSTSKKLKVYMKLASSNSPKIAVDMEKQFIDPTADIITISNLVKDFNSNPKKYIKPKKRFNLAKIACNSLIIYLSVLALKCEVVAPMRVVNVIEEEVNTSSKSEKEITLQMISRSIDALDNISTSEKNTVKARLLSYFDDNYEYYDQKTMGKIINSFENVVIERSEKSKPYTKKTTAASFRNRSPFGTKNVITLYEGALSPEEDCLSHELYHASQFTHQEPISNQNILREMSAYSFEGEYCGGETSLEFIEDYVVLKEVLGKEYLFNNVFNSDNRAIYKKLAELSGEKKSDIKKVIKDYTDWYVDIAKRRDEFGSVREGLKSIISKIDDPEIKDNFVVRNYLQELGYQRQCSTVFDDEYIYVNESSETPILYVNKNNKFLSEKEIESETAREYLNSLYSNYVTGTLSKEDARTLNVLILLCSEDEKKQITQENFADTILLAMQKYNNENFDLNKLIVNMKVVNSKNYKLTNEKSFQDFYSLFYNRVSKEFANVPMCLEDIADYKMIADDINEYKKSKRVSEDTYGELKNLSITKKINLVDEIEDVFIENSNLKWIKRDPFDLKKSELINFSDLYFEEKAKHESVRYEKNEYTCLFTNDYIQEVLDEDMDVHLEYTEDGVKKYAYNLQMYNVYGQQCTGQLFKDETSERLHSSYFIYTFAEKDPIMLKKYIQTNK